MKLWLLWPRPSGGEDPCAERILQFTEPWEIRCSLPGMLQFSEGWES